MTLTEEQVEQRINSSNNLANLIPNKRDIPVVTEKVIKSPGKNRVNLTEKARTEIATRARLGEKQVTLAKEFGIGSPAVSNIENGKVKGIDEDAVAENIGKVRDKALDRLMTSLGLITDDKLSGCSAKELSGIAANMGRVVEKTMPKEKANDQINLVIYAPELKQEIHFEKKIV